MKPLDRNERNRLLEQLKLIDSRTLTPEGSRLYSVAERQAMGAQAKELQKTYLFRLPRVPIARCPFTNHLVVKAMDIYGFDGEWWSDGGDIDPEGSPYTVTYLGALNFMGQEPEKLQIATARRILLGPEVPYVIPRLLEIESVKCIIYGTQLLDQKYPVYFMTYFAKPQLPPNQSHQMWLRSSFYYVEREQLWWKVSNDAWDFNLARWLKKLGKILWIHPNDSEMKLCSEPPEDFPCLNLELYG